MALETRPGQVILHFGTTPGNERTNGKPLWARGANIYRKKAVSPAFSLLAFDSASPYIRKFGPNSGHYAL